MGAKVRVIRNFAQTCALPRTTTPPSGVSERFDSGRAYLNCGATYFWQATEKKNIFECVSIWVKGGWKETRGVRRPISGKRPVSESRMTSLNPFETKRKKAHAGASSRVCDWFVAGRQGFEPWGRSHAQRFSRPPHSTTLPPPRCRVWRRVYCARHPEARGVRALNGDFLPMAAKRPFLGRGRGLSSRSRGRRRTRARQAPDDRQG